MSTEAAKEVVEEFREIQSNYDKYMAAMAQAMHKMPYSEWIMRQAIAAAHSAEGE